MPRRLPATVALVGLLLGCGSKPPPPAPEPPPPPPEKKVEAPPPPPKCEALEENCKAEAGTRAKIAGSSLVFTPISGWIYAQGAVATVAQGSAESGPAIVLFAYSADKDPQKDSSQRDTAFGHLAKQVNLTLPKTKVAWKTPMCRCSATTCAGIGGEICTKMKPVSDLKASVWQLDGGVRGGKKGPMLVVQAILPDNKALLGVGFVPDDDQSGADQAILKSIESIGPGADGDKKDEKKEEKDAGKDAGKPK